MALTDSSGAVATEYTYEPFGATTFTSSSSGNSYQFSGRENDGTGLCYCSWELVYLPVCEIGCAIVGIVKPPVGVGCALAVCPVYTAVEVWECLDETRRDGVMEAAVPALVVGIGAVFVVRRTMNGWARRSVAVGALLVGVIIITWPLVPVIGVLLLGLLMVVSPFWWKFRTHLPVPWTVIESPRRPAPAPLGES